MYSLSSIHSSPIEPKVQVYEKQRPMPWTTITEKRSDFHSERLKKSFINSPF